MRNYTDDKTILHADLVTGNVGIRNSNPKTTLDVVGQPTVTDVNDGIIAPRLKRSELIAKTAYGADQVGAIVYVTDSSGTLTTATNEVIAAGYYYFDGTSWKSFKTAAATGSSKWENVSGTDNLVRLINLSDNATARPANNGIFIKDNGNIGIGIASPDAYSKLDISSTNQGILVPRVTLTSGTMDLNSDNDNNISNQPVGLMVFNSSGTLSQGFYFWNGSEWRTLNNSLAAIPSISALDCSSVNIEPSTFTSGVAYSGTLSVPYTGGNGGTYQAGTAFTQNGLTFKLQPGTLAIGVGNLVYSVSGTPNFSSPTSISVPISFDSKNCSASIGAKSTVQSIQFATKTVSPLNASTPANSQLNFGNISVRLSHTSSSGAAIQFTTPFATHYTARTNLYGAGAGGDGGGTIVGAITSPGTWTNFSGSLSPANKDIAIINLVLQTTKEVYRITVNTSGDLTSPTSSSQGTLFVEKLN